MAFIDQSFLISIKNIYKITLMSRGTANSRCLCTLNMVWAESFGCLQTSPQFLKNNSSDLGRYLHFSNFVPPMWYWIWTSVAYLRDKYNDECTVVILTLENAFYIFFDIVLFTGDTTYEIMLVGAGYFLFIGKSW